MSAELSILAAKAELDQALVEIARIVERELMRLVAEMDTAGKVLQSTKDNIANVMEIRARVQEIAYREGVPRVLAVLEREIPLVIKEALASDYPALGQFAPQIEADLQRVLAGQVDEIASQLGPSIADDLARAAREQIMGGSVVAELEARIAEQLDVSLGRVSVLLERTVREVHDESMRRSGQAASEVLGEEIVYVYVGPDDSVTRDYCDARVGRYLDQAEADGLDPRQRFNCRHSLAPILKSEAEKRGIQPFA